jgi:hypothetical protein
MNPDAIVEPDQLIADAEEIPDPLAGLAEKTAADPGAPFMPEALEALAALNSDNRAAFEALRSQLKKAGCRVTALDDAIAEENGDTGGRGPTQADILIGLAQTAELFHTADGSGFADLDINGHRETWPIRGKGFRRWLARRFFEETGGAPSSEALQSALNVIEAKAHFDAPERQVHIRVGGLDGRLYLDLGDETWRAVEMDAAGWRVIDNPPVRFRRASGMKPMPIPVRGGSIETLRSFLNVQTDADFALVVAWALACLRNRGPYPVIVLSGEQGSAKSTFSAILRSLLDPNTAPLRALPREDRDLFIAASNGHVLAFDNVSGLPAWISDTLCRLATGGGFAVRQLYSDQDEVLFDAARPVILNGIEDIVKRPDLADRAVFLTLEPIPEERRRPEQELWAAFEAERPRLLGVLLDAVAKGLAELPRTKLDKLPRMADFAFRRCSSQRVARGVRPWRRSKSAMRNGSRSRWRAKHGRQRIVRVELRAARRSLGGANRRADGVETCKEGPNPVERSTRESLPLRVAPRCLARTRSGTRCQKPAAKGKKRCRLHGGAEGSGAPRGNRNGSYRHGLYTREAIAERKMMRALIRSFREDARAALSELDATSGSRPSRGDS